MAVKNFDPVGFVMDYENGSLDDAQVIEGFQQLINSGLAWRLQGFYGRTASMLIDAGYCTRQFLKFDKYTK